MPRPREFDEGLVLRAARDAFWATGYAGTSIDALSSATRLGKGSLYGAFGSKSELYVRVIEDHCDRRASAASRALAGPPERAMDRIVEFVRREAELIAGDEAHQGCLIAKAAAESGQHEPAIRQAAGAALTRIKDDLAVAFEQAQACGAATRQFSSDELAGTMLAMLRGIEAMGKAGVDPRQIRSIAECAIGLVVVGAHA